MNRYTGKQISRSEHLRQSIGDILTTRIGTRLHRRDYGSFLPDLVDAPVNPETQMLLIAASVHAIMRNEPRILVTRVQVSDLIDTGLEILIEARDQNGNDIELDIPLNLRGSV